MRKIRLTSGIHYALINTFSLGLLGIIDKIGATNLNSSLVFSTQSVIYALLFSIVIFLSKQKKLFSNFKKVELKYYFLIIAIGLLASGLFIFLRFLGLKESLGTFATISQVLTTTLTAILAYIFLNERFGKTFWFYFILIITSIYLVSIGDFKIAKIAKGDTFIILGTFALAIANILIKKTVLHTGVKVLTLGRLFFGALFLIAATIIFNQNNLFELSIWPIASGLFWAINIIAFNMAVKRISLTLATSILMIAPIITLFLEIIILDERITYIQIAASFVVVISGILLIRTQRKKYIT